jgi:hypothetical protein
VESDLAVGEDLVGVGGVVEEVVVVVAGGDGVVEVGVAAL